MKAIICKLVEFDNDTNISHIFHFCVHSHSVVQMPRIARSPARVAQV